MPRQPFLENLRLDAFAFEGMRFSDAYVAASVCSLTPWASLLTGHYPARVGITHDIPVHAIGRMADVPYFHLVPKNERNFASALRDGGYPQSRTDPLSPKSEVDRRDLAQSAAHLLVRSPAQCTIQCASGFTNDHLIQHLVPSHRLPLRISG